MRVLTTSSVFLAVAVSAITVAYAEKATIAWRDTPARSNRAPQTPQVPAAAGGRQPAELTAVGAPDVEAHNRAVAQEEARIMGTLRGIEQQLAAEQQLLERRLQYAEQLRQKGLKDENRKLLEQAEQVERQAVQLYQQRVAQFEKVEVNAGSRVAPGRPAPSVQPRRSNQPAQPARPAQPAGRAGGSRQPAAGAPRTTQALDPAPTANTNADRANATSSSRRSWWPFTN
ncbi:MAG: hypothetical protein J5I93_16930 [Pirellulaceae bacterium]|nr:hypothetical protein [Pirellulaceae bacterium]